MLRRRKKIWKPFDEFRINPEGTIGLISAFVESFETLGSVAIADESPSFKSNGLEDCVTWVVSF